MEEEIGLLGRITGGIQNFFDNPTVQGVAGAAAIGANPLVGLLAGPVIKRSRERRRLENDFLREQLTGSRRRTAAQDELRGLLARRATVQAPDRVGGLLDPEGEGFAEINLPSRRQSVPAISTPEGQQQALGLLGDIAPAQTAQGLLGQIIPGQGRAETALVRNLRAAGIDPASPEGQELIRQAVTGGDIQQQLDILKLQQAQRDLDNELRNSQSESETAKSQIQSSINDIVELFSLNDQLEGTFQQPGLPLADTRQTIGSVGSFLGELIGADTGETAGNVNAAQRFDGLATSVLIDSIAKLDKFGNLTNQKLDTLLQTKPGSDVGPQANRQILADLLEEMLNAADSKGVSVNNREQIQALIDGARGTDTSEESKGSGNRRLVFDPSSGSVSAK